MTWTPEMVYGSIGAVGAGLVAIAGALNKLKIVKIPFRRNGSQFAGMSISELEDRCRKIHNGINGRLIDIEKDNSKQEADIEHVEKRLDKGDEKFEAIQQKLEVINGNIILQGVKYEKREEDLTRTLTDATGILREALKRLG